MVQAYLAAISGVPKTAELVSRFVVAPELKDHIAMFEAAFPVFELTGEDFVSERDEVAVRATFSGKHLGKFQGIPATGREVSIPVMLIYQIADGRIARSWANADRLGLLGQLGVLPQLPPSPAH
jgi:predicted ester cyclase